MPRTPHIERHFTASDRVRDVVIGMSDGLTVPFALAAEIAAGGIAMGLGGYLAARSDAEHYTIERAREIAETGTKPAAEAAEVTHILRSFGLAAEESAPIVAALRKRPEAWVDFMMRFELGLEKPDPRLALSSALTIGGAYVAGGFIPLAPYMALASAPMALTVSVVVTVVALGLFGWIKGRFTGMVPLRSAFQTMLIGGAAAAAAFPTARAITYPVDCRPGRLDPPRLRR